MGLHRAAPVTLAVVVTVTPWVGGYPMSTICRYSQVSWVDRWPYGNIDARFHLHVPPRFRHHAIRADATVEMRWGKTLWTGRLVSMDWSTGELAASGLIGQGSRYLGLNRVLEPGPGLYYLRPSVNLEQAIDTAIAGGPAGVMDNSDEITDRTPLGWKRTDPLWAADMFDPGVPPEEFSKIFPDLVDLAAQRGAGTPYMGADGRLRYLTPATTPSWLTQPATVDIDEAAGSDRLTSVIVIYLDSTDGNARKHKWVTDTRFVPHREEIHDAREAGPMTPTEAATIGEAILAEHLRPVYGSDVVLSPLTATTGTGGVCWPVVAHAGQVVRVQGASHPRLSGNHIDFIAGEITVSDAETTTPTAVAKPENKPPRTYAETTEATLTAIRKAAA